MQAQGPVPRVTRCWARQQWSAEHERRAPRCCMITAGCGGRVVECRHRRVARLSALCCTCDGLSMPLPLRHTVHCSAHSAQRSAVRGGGAGWVLQGYVYVDCAALRHALNKNQAYLGMRAEQASPATPVRALSAALASRQVVHPYSNLCHTVTAYSNRPKVYTTRTSGSGSEPCKLYRISHPPCPSPPSRI